jgi:hypothetical protein
VSDKVLNSEFSGGDSHGNFVEDLKSDLTNLFMCNTWSVQSSETVIVYVLRSVTRIRLVKFGNPSTCSTVNWKVCKSAIALYCLY